MLTFCTTIESNIGFMINKKKKNMAAESYIWPPVMILTLRQENSAVLQARVNFF